jgi:hypothetical protein
MATMAMTTKKWKCISMSPSYTSISSAVLVSRLSVTADERSR